MNALRRSLIGFSLALALATTVRAQDGERFILVNRSLETREVVLAYMDAAALVVVDDSREDLVIPRSKCVALVRADAAERRSGPANRRDRRYLQSGLLLLSNGQRLPGSVEKGGGVGEGMIRWVHDWLGTIAWSLDDVSTVVFDAGFSIPDPGAGDVVVLRNGDRLDGFLVSLEDPITIELEEGGLVEMPLERVAAIRLVTGEAHRSVSRLWFNDGTVIDVANCRVGDDGYLRLARLPGTEPIPERLSGLDAIQFDSSAILPLADLTPTRVRGDDTRFSVPEPRTIDDVAALDLRRVELRGPLTVRYRVPAGCTRFAADAVLSESARAWGDLEIVVRSGKVEVYRSQVDSTQPRASINVPLTDRTLEIELLPGRYGPIQDHVLLERAMLLVGE